MDMHHIIRRAGLSARPVVFLHGSGGDETDLIDLADIVAPDRPCIFLRGTLPWEGGWAFFRRHADRSLDLVDLADRAAELAGFLAVLRQTRTMSSPPVLLGYSNGAIITEKLLRRAPGAIAGAVLLRTLSPETESDGVELRGKPILLTEGGADERRAKADASISARRLRALGANVELKTYEAGHGLAPSEPADIARWLAGVFPN